MPEAAADPERKPSERPAPQAVIRTCGPAQTAPNPLRRSVLWPSSRPIALGQGVVDRRQISAAYVQGTVKPPEFSGHDGTATARPDSGSGGYAFLGAIDPDEPANNPDNFVMTNDNFKFHVDGKDPRVAWANANKATLRRMTYYSASFEKAGPFRMDDERPTSAMPNAPTARFVRFVSPLRFFGFVVAIDTASECATGALADALGHPVSLRSTFGTEGTLFDPTTKDKVQKLLVRDGAIVRISVIGNKPIAAVEAIVASTSCGPADVLACEKLIQDLTEAANAETSAAAVTPDYTALTTDVDPHWSVTDFDAYKVDYLLPLKP